MNFRRFAGKVLSGWYIVTSKIHPSFSQAGEDQIIRYLFELLKIANPSYLDIGANHPVIGNNSFYFYIRGGRGVCVEPDPSFYSVIKKKRPRDIVLQTGVNTGSAEKAELYIFPHPYSGWNTFVREEAEKREKETGIAVKKTEWVSLVNINDVIQKYFHPHPNLLSIDVEGLDLAIVQSMNFALYKPEVICIESITFSMTNEEVKINDVIDFLNSKGYFLFADTHINSIFCRTDAFKQKRQ
jgi:FkbM family methyltransferase